MASTGKKGKKNKGVTVRLHDFLSDTTTSWSDVVDEEDKFREFNRKPALPAAPRAARAIELDESKIPKSPPYVAYLSNLSYELEQDDIINAFADLNISTVRLPRDERSGRMKGFGYVEFNDRASFISALQKNEATIRGRRIRINIAENIEGERRRGGGGGGGMRDNRERDTNYDSERTSGDWRSGPRSEFSMNDDRRGPMSGRKDYGGFRDRDGFDKRGDKESSWRDNERRFGNDRESRGSYGNRRNYDEPETNYSESKTRRKLNLKPRTVPVEEIISKEESLSKTDEEAPQEKPTPTSASIFGQAKPVDTAAREREIERRLEKEREEAKNEKDIDKLKTKSEEEEVRETKVLEPAPEPKENPWTRKSQKPENQDINSGEHSGKTDYLNKSSLNNEDEKEVFESSEDSQCIETKKNDDYESDREVDGRYNRYDNRYNDSSRENDKSYRRDDRYKEDRDRRDRRDDRRDRGYDYDKRGGNSGGRGREQERDGESRRYNDRDGDQRRYSSDKEADWRKSTDKDLDNRRHQPDRDNSRYRDDHGTNKGPRGDKRSGSSATDKGSRYGKNTQERERGQQIKAKDPKKTEEGFKMPKLKETAAPNYIGTNKYSFLDEDEVSE